MEELKGMVGRVAGEAKQRKVWEVLDSAAGPPPLPLKSAYSSRSPSSRQVHHFLFFLTLWSDLLQLALTWSNLVQLASIWSQLV